MLMRWILRVVREVASAPVAIAVECCVLHARGLAVGGGVFVVSLLRLYLLGHHATAVFRFSSSSSAPAALAKVMVEGTTTSYVIFHAHPHPHPHAVHVDGSRRGRMSGNHGRSRQRPRNRGGRIGGR